MAIRISVVIPALNEQQNIGRAVTSVWEADVDEVVVVDGGSTDATIARAKACGADVLEGKRGRAQQMNLGAEKSTGDVLLFLHADNWLAPQVGEQVRDCLLTEEIMGGAFQQQIDSAGFMYRMLERGNAMRVRWRGLAYGDQAIFMRRRFFQQLGSFPTIQLMEDLMLMRAFRKISCPALLPGPVHVDPRRWRQHGIVRQTLCNWTLLGARALGVAPDRLARFYPPHSESGA